MRNHQRTRRIDTRLLRRILQTFAGDCLGLATAEVGVHLVGETEIARLNSKYLQHRGPTDVIAFDYRENQAEPLKGEIFICVPVALEQALRFRTRWQEELVRYAVHGMLHLCGYDDQDPESRRRMKREENRGLKALSRLFYFPKVGGHVAHKADE